MVLPIIRWGLGLVATTYVAKKGYDIYSETQKENEARDRQRRKDEESRREEQKAREHEDKLSKAKDEIADFEKLWKKRFESLLLVDSNIWMNRDYDDFFKELEWVMQKFLSSIKMSSVQFDEIINLKNLSYDNPKSKLARCALSRIEYFQNINLIEIIPMGMDAKKSAYADPDIIEILIDSLSKYSAMTLVSDDRELRIRANQIMKDKQANDFKSITGQDIFELIKEYHPNIDFVS
jgi:hypothetical protein